MKRTAGRKWQFFGPMALLLMAVTACGCGGGGGGGGGGGDGPAHDTWLPTSTGPPSGRSFHTAVWTGSWMIVCGGWDSSTDFNTGGRYTP